MSASSPAAASADPDPDPLLRLEPITSAPAWSLPKLVAFRFAFLVAAQMVFPFPFSSLAVLPKLDWLPELLMKPWDWLVSWTATDVLGLDPLSTAPTGSGDTTRDYVFHLVIVVLAVIGTVVWSVLDRRRTSYARLADGAIVVLRYYLAFFLLGYALAKLTQFPPPGPGRFDERVGELSPMGMLWTFMGSSQPYSLFAGCAEGLGGVLLLWRRTSVAGALVAMAAMTNVVMLNFCYDVPVKLFSTQLLAIAAVIALPHARRLIGAVLGRATPEVPPRPRRSPRFERGRLVAKVLFLLLGAYQFYQEVDQSLVYRNKQRHELHGVWVVEQLVMDGAERPPLTTDATRWNKLYLAEQGGGMRLMNDERVRFPLAVDEAKRTIEIKGQPAEVWTYTKTEDGGVTRAVLDGTFKGKRFHATLRREPEPLLVTRGFHWINETPFNR